LALASALDRWLRVTFGRGFTIYPHNFFPNSSMRDIKPSTPPGPIDCIILPGALSGREPTSAQKAEARARLKRLFERVDEYGCANNVSPDEADAAIDEAVRRIRTQAP
jgi:hypothetical protein